MKFILMVEGHTEKQSIAPFFKRWLDPQLKQPIRIHVVRLDGEGAFKRKVARKTKDYLNSPQQNEIIAVVGLLDLYGTDIFPENMTTIQERYDYGVEHFENEVGCDDRFYMFFAVHEYEAWLLSQPDIFPIKMQNDVKKISQPETVNFNTPPAKYLHNLYKKHLKKGYRKVTDGKQLFHNLDSEQAINKCPYLKKMLSTMLTLAQDAEV